MDDQCDPDCKEDGYCFECLACAYEDGEIDQVYDDHVHCTDEYQIISRKVTKP